jgi:hypothetical protein
MRPEKITKVRQDVGVRVLAGMAGLLLLSGCYEQEAVPRDQRRAEVILPEPNNC